MIVHLWAPIRACHFFIGVLWGLKYQKVPTNNKGNHVSNTLVVEFCSFILVCLNLSCIYFGALKGPQFWSYWTFLEEFAVVPVLSLWIYFISQAPSNVGLTMPFLNSWPVHKLGEISYSIYVLHWPLLRFYMWMKIGFAPMHVDSGLAFFFALENYDLPIVLAVIISLSGIAYHFIENPARVWITKYSTKRKGATQSAIRMSVVPKRPR